MRIMKHMTILVLLTVSLVGCNQSAEKSKNQIPTDDAVNQFLRQKGIHELDHLVTKDGVVVLYQNTHEVGLYGIYLDGDGKLKVGSHSWSESEKVPSGVDVSHTSGETAYAIVIMNDEKIRERANKVIVQFNNHEVYMSTEKGKIGYIIKSRFVDENTRFVKLTIVDNQGKMIYETRS